MPKRALRPCAYPGCTALVSSGYCPKHRAVAKPPRTEAEREKHRLYDRRWRREREAQLARQPWCEDCLRANIYTEASEVHHEERHEGDREKFRSSKKTSLCKRCHSIRTAKEVGLSVRGRGGKKVLSEGVSSAWEVKRVKKSPIETCTETNQEGE